MIELDRRKVNTPFMISSLSCSRSCVVKLMLCCAARSLSGLLCCVYLLQCKRMCVMFSVCWQVWHLGGKDLLIYASMCVNLVAFNRSLAMITSSLLMGLEEVYHSSICLLCLCVISSPSHSLCQFCRSVILPLVRHDFKFLGMGVVTCSREAVFANLSACSLPCIPQ